MGWDFKPREYRMYPRSTVVEVLAVLSFFPILELRDGENRIAEFHKKFRGDFPAVSRGVAKKLYMGSSGVEQRVENVFVSTFSSKDGASVIGLETDALWFRCTAEQYPGREVVQRQFLPAFEAFADLFPLVPVRFGLRYVNLLSKAEGDPSTLVNPELIRSAQFLLDGSSKVTLLDVTSDLSPGKLRIRSGFQPINDKPDFVIDLDRFVDDQLDLEGIPKLLPSFQNDIYNAFMSLATPRLTDWMEKNERN